MKYLLTMLALVAAIAMTVTAADARHHHKPAPAHVAYENGFADGEHYAERGFLYGECKPRVEAPGDAELWERWAKSRARKSWRQAVRQRYGERFMAHPVDEVMDCAPSSVNGWYPRCTVSAIPCAKRVRQERD